MRFQALAVWQTFLENGEVLSIIRRQIMGSGVAVSALAGADTLAAGLTDTFDAGGCMLGADAAACNRARDIRMGVGMTRRLLFSR